VRNPFRAAGSLPTFAERQVIALAPATQVPHPALPALKLKLIGMWNHRLTNEFAWRRLDALR